MIPYARQSISEEDILSVQQVLRSDYLTQGPAIDNFEKAIAHYCGAKHGVAICNATSALHLACLALGLGPGDILWTSPNTFVASANCGLYCGATVDFVDIDPRTYNMCPQVLERKLIEAERINKLPKIVIPVHFGGQVCDMEAIHKLAQKYHFFIVEDASHALGSNYLGHKTGDCFFSDITVFSFHPVKLITTGEGGMILTNNTNYYEKLTLLRSHGITRNPKNMVSEYQGDWYYQQVSLGYNYRMTDIQAALGISQLAQLDKFIEKRHHLAEIYQAELQDLPLLLPYQHPDSRSAWHLFVIQLKNSKKRKEVFNALRKVKINVNVHYIPVHIQPFYQQLGFKVGDYPQAEQYYQRTVSLPIHYRLSEREQVFIIEELRIHLF